MMETKDWESSSEELNGIEVNTQYDDDGDGEDDDDDEYCNTSGLISKFQFRKDMSKARWNEDMRMAEIVENKGRMWTTTGVIRNSKIYCSIEETLFLVEVGALSIVKDDTPVSLMNLYEKVATGKYGCCWETFEVYRHLKSLGYIVLRHGIPWTMKNVKTESIGAVDKSPSKEEDNILIDLFNGMQINEARALFDVFLPNSKFRKSSPENPSFVLCSTRGYPPSKTDIEALERHSNGIPLKFCHIEHGRVNYFNFNLVELPHLP